MLISLFLQRLLYAVLCTSSKCRNHISKSTCDDVLQYLKFQSLAVRCFERMQVAQEPCAYQFISQLYIYTKNIHTYVEQKQNIQKKNQFECLHGDGIATKYFPSPPQFFLIHWFSWWDLVWYIEHLNFSTFLTPLQNYRRNCTKIGEKRGEVEAGGVMKTVCLEKCICASKWKQKKGIPLRSRRWHDWGTETFFPLFPVSRQK